MKAIIYFLSLLLVTFPLSARTLGFLYALDEDWKQLVFELGGHAESVNQNGANLERIKFEDIEVYGKKMGSGPVQTAISTQALLSAVKPDLVISVGPIGALADKVEVGQVFMVEQVVPWQTVPHLESASPSSFKKLLPLVPLGDWGSLLESSRTVTIASGEIFITSSELRISIRMSTGADYVDMNLYGLLTAVNIEKIPSIHLRIISDFANEEAGEAFKTFRKSYKGVLGKKTADLIKNLPKDPSNPDNYPELKKLFPDLD